MLDDIIPNNDIQESSIESNQPISESVEIPDKSFPNLETRNKSIINEYTQGVPIKQIAVNHNLSEPQIYVIVRKNPDIVNTNRELEKIRRLRRLRLVEDKTSPKMACKDASELVKVIEAQRKELEGDNSASTVNNTQINISGDMKVMNVGDKWNLLRSALENT